MTPDLRRKRSLQFALEVYEIPGSVASFARQQSLRRWHKPAHSSRMLRGLNRLNCVEWQRVLGINRDLRRRSGKCAEFLESDLDRGSQLSHPTLVNLRTGIQNHKERK